MSELLKGNFKVQKPVEAKTDAMSEDDKFKAEYRKKALESIGGSMVFIEREKLFWDGGSDESDK